MAHAYLTLVTSEAAIEVSNAVGDTSTVLKFVSKLEGMNDLWLKNEFSLRGSQWIVAVVNASEKVRSFPEDTVGDVGFRKSDASKGLCTVTVEVPTGQFELLQTAILRHATEDDSRTIWNLVEVPKLSIHEVLFTVEPTQVALGRLSGAAAIV